ncbi:MAG TPA: winged helix-turn-helix domain-containing protein [Thermoleophilaceae bacterium]
MGRGLSHTLRIRIIMSLLETKAELSATDLANRLGTSVNKIDHHVKCLLALRMIESKRTHQGRGARQHFYSLTPAVRDLLAAVVRHPLPPHVDARVIEQHTLPFSTATRSTRPDPSGP